MPLHYVLPAGAVTLMANKTATAVGLANDGAIWDLGHQTLPYIPYDHLTSVLLLGLPVLVHGVPLQREFWQVFGHVFGIVLLFRSITMITTVLPQSDPSCDCHSFGVADALVGHCFDTMFSGHVAFSVILTGLMVAFGWMSPMAAAFWSSSTAMYMVATRAHYTFDVVVGSIIAGLTTKVCLSGVVGSNGI